MIPPPIKTKKEVPLTDELKDHLEVHKIDDLTEMEVKAYSLLEGMLVRKVASKDFKINILKLNKYFNNTRKIAMTEFMCRRLINKYEYEYYAATIFTITHGTPKWKRHDDIRKRAVKNHDL